MFDVATRPQPNTSSAAAVFGVPFDWRLTQSGTPSDYPWTNFASPTGVPEKRVDVLATYALQLEETLQTAIIISLFTDRRAGPDDKLPLNQTDRRGWVGDEFAAEGPTSRRDEWGTLLWLVYTGKVTDDVPGFAQFTCQEGLSWLVRAGIASRVVVTAQWSGDRLVVRPQIYQADQASPVYDVLWGTSIRKLAQ